MALNFGDESGRDNFNINGPQFDPGGDKTKIITQNITGEGEAHPLTTYTTIYTVPAGRTLFISKITKNIVNASAGTTSYTKIKDILIWTITLAAQTTYEMDFGSPIILKAGETIKSGNLSADASVANVYIGWET